MSGFETEWLEQDASRTVALLRLAGADPVAVAADLGFELQSNSEDHWDVVELLLIDQLNLWLRQGRFV